MAIPDVNLIPVDVLADMQVVADALANGEPLPAEVERRIQERSQKAQKELLSRYGVREIAVDLIRDIRDEE